MIDILLINQGQNETSVKTCINAILANDASLINRIDLLDINPKTDLHINLPKLTYTVRRGSLSSIPQICNEYAKAATGEFVNFSYTNFLFYKTKLASQVQRAKKFKECSLVYHDIERISSGGKIEKVLAHPFHMNILLQKNILTPSYIVKTQIFNKVGGYSIKPNFDFEHEFMFKVAQESLCLHIPQYLMGVQV